jgi:hypothetical protein
MPNNDECLNEVELIGYEIEQKILMGPHAML